MIYATVFIVLVALVWLAAAASLWNDLSTLRRLPELKSIAPSAGVSVVFAARDEQDRVGNTVATLLAQNANIVEVIAVDDRSTDRTPQILQEAAAKDVRLRVIRIDTLPPGWLGKPHALHLGAAEAKGEWILFTDADVGFSQDVIARAVAAGEREGVEHVCLIPKFSPRERRMSILGQAASLTFLLSLSKVLGRVNRDDERSFSGVGAFNLVRTDAYRAIGGHEPLRMEVVDDPMLGLLLKRQGRRTRAYAACDSLDCDWSTTIVDVLRRLEKNHFAILRFRTLPVVFFLCFCGVLWLTAILGPFFGGAGWLPLLAMLAVAAPAARLAHVCGIPVATAALVPFMFPILALALANSTWRTLRQGGVRWRDTFYPLAELRAGCIQWTPFEKIGPE